MTKLLAKRAWGSRLAALGLALVSVMACGAAGAKDKGGGKKPPLSPDTYDPRVSLAPLVERVSPAVVNIRTKAALPQLHGMPGPDSLFEFFFGPRRRLPRPDRIPMPRSMGSGFIVHPSGLVVTNHHVVERADEIEVQLADDREFDAEVVGSDERTDVALLRLKDAKGLPTVEFGDSSALKVGDHVVAIGNPFGLDHTVTSGIVSAKERVIGAGPYDDFIQTDASINPGNSGGPLFNLKGEVVGINTAIAPAGQGIGFAIPSNLARGLVESLRTQGKVVRGWLGIAFQPLDDDLAKAFGTEADAGAVVSNVDEGSPGQKGGMKAGDIITEVNGVKLKSARQLPSLVAGIKPNKVVPFAVIRDGKKVTLKVQIGEMPAEMAGGSTPRRPGSKSTESGLGIEVHPLDDALRKKLDAREVENGVVVVEVKPGSVASGVLRTGDIIVEVNRKKVDDIAQFEKAVKGLKTGQRMLMRVYRRGSWSYLTLER